jgi:hypothetical protein
VLTVRPKINELNFNLFGRSVHPELFEICESRTYVRDLYELTLNITSDGHLICLRHQDSVLAEVSASSNHPLPTQQVLISHPIQKNDENKSEYNDIIRYQSSVNLEAVKPKIFVTIQQQLGEKIECEGLVHRFQSNGRIAFGAISYMNVQSFKSHVLVRSFHTFPDTCTVMKSESRFSLDDAST